MSVDLVAVAINVGSEFYEDLDLGIFVELLGVFTVNVLVLLNIVGGLYLGVGLINALAEIVFNVVSQNDASVSTV